MLYATILSWMLALQPAAPWLDTYATTALEIDSAARTHPAFTGEDGALRTAAVLVAIAKFESNFRPDALGDCHAGKPRTFANCQSVGAWQISKANGAPSAENAAGLIRTSFRVCASRPVVERLGWYAAGGSGCSRAMPQSRHRMALAERLLERQDLVD